nr:helix-turn-helix domain-containing protein [Allochromatium palmeri]
MFVQFAASPVDILDWQRRVLSEPTLSHTASRIATRLSLYINSTTACAWPSLRRLARDSQTSYSSVKRAIKDLVALNLLQVEPGDAQHTNRYRALLHVAAPSVHTDAAPITPPPATTEIAPVPTRTTPESQPAPEPTPTPAAPPPVDDPQITQVIDHLNQRADTAFPSTPGSQSHSLVHQALRTQPPETLCAVIDLKVSHLGRNRTRSLPAPRNPVQTRQARRLSLRTAPTAHRRLRAVRPIGPVSAPTTDTQPPPHPGQRRRLLRRPHPLHPRAAAKARARSRRAAPFRRHVPHARRPPAPP